MTHAQSAEERLAAGRRTRGMMKCRVSATSLEVISFTYKTAEQCDSIYISNLNRSSVEISAVLLIEADLVLADLTKTPERAEVIQFCKSIMTVGLNVLLHKSQGEQHITSTFGPFSFLTVWRADLWLMVTCAVVLFAAACYAAARWAGAPDRVRALESKGTDSLSPCGSLWFTGGALLQRDTGIYPR
ncbi:UNVERIFIED_CONTAM: Glutamate receptor 2 [Trichonephila clavipes]